MFCPVGGTGRRYGLRIHWENPCRFNSCTGHHQVRIAFGFLERMFGGFFSFYRMIGLKLWNRRIHRCSKLKE